MCIKPTQERVDARRSYPRRGAHADPPLLQERVTRDAQALELQPPPGISQIVYQPHAHTRNYGLNISVREDRKPPPNAAQRGLLENLEQSPQESAVAVIEKAEAALKDGDLGRALWEELEESARNTLHGATSLALLIRCLKAFVLAGHPDVDRLFNRIASQAAPLIGSSSSGQLVTLLHWMSRAGLRDATVINHCGNEMLLRTTHDFVTEMFIEVLNSHALLDIRHPQLTQECSRELVTEFPHFTKEQCSQMAPLTVISMLPDSARMEYLKRCADLQMALPATSFKESVVYQFRLLQLMLEAEHRAAQLPVKVQEWLERIKFDAAEYTRKAAPKAQLSRTEKDVYRVLEQVLGLHTLPAKQHGIFCLHLAVEASMHTFEVLKREHFFVSPSPTHHAQRPEVKLRHRLLVRQGWKPVVIREAEWWEWLDDDERATKLLQLIEGSHRSRMNA